MRFARVVFVETFLVNGSFGIIATLVSLEVEVVLRTSLPLIIRNIIRISISVHAGIRFFCRFDIRSYGRGVIWVRDVGSSARVGTSLMCGLMFRTSFGIRAPFFANLTLVMVSVSVILDVAIGTLTPSTPHALVLVLLELIFSLKPFPTLCACGMEFLVVCV